MGFRRSFDWRFGRWFGAALLALSMTAASADAARSQAELIELRRSIDALLTRLAAERAQAQSLGGEVEALERQLVDLLARRGAEQRALAQSKAQRGELETRLRALQSRQRAYRDELAQLVRVSYQLGRQSALKLLLSQRDPSEAARALSIFRYLSQSRNRRIEAGVALQREWVAARGDLARQERQLAESLARLAHTESELADKRAERARRLAAIRERMREGRAQVDRFQRRERALQQLLARLRRPKPDAAQANIAESAAGDAAASIASSPPRKSDAHAARDDAAQNNIAESVAGDAAASIASSPPRKPFALRGFQHHKGELDAPVAGRVAARFGQPRAESGLAWRGLLFEAAEGAEVVAIYPGQVVFSDWFRGYGQLLVLDHGDGYMSLYGHNRALRAAIGDGVNAGDSIGEVGATGGLDAPGLYFEIRHNGEPRDPLEWCRI